MEVYKIDILSIEMLDYHDFLYKIIFLFKFFND